MRKSYMLVTWPESQKYMDNPWFDNEAILENSGKYGGQTYFIPAVRISEHDKENELGNIQYNEKLLTLPQIFDFLILNKIPPQFDVDILFGHTKHVTIISKPDDVDWIYYSIGNKMVCVVPTDHHIMGSLHSSNKPTP